jgi:hypothetical protein
MYLCDDNDKGAKNQTGFSQTIVSSRKTTEKKATFPQKVAFFFF